MPHLIDTLESRTLFATFSLSETGVLSVFGSNNRDFVSLYGIKDSYALSLDGEVKAAYKKTAITGVVIWGYGGDDRLAVSSNLIAPVTIVGGDGNDVILGGKGNDILVGGPGKDSLDGRDGNDILRGDYGNDTLRGGNGDDFLYGGNTADNKGKDTYDGGTGNDTLLNTTNTATPSLVVITSVKNVEDRNQPDTFRPTGRLFPEATSAFSPVLTAVVSAKNDVAAFTQYTLPSANAQFLTANTLRTRTTGTGDNRNTVLFIPVLALSFGGDTAAPAVTAAPPFTSAVLRPGRYEFALDSNENPPKSSVVLNDYTITTGNPFSIQRITT